MFFQILKTGNNYGRKTLWAITLMFIRGFQQTRRHPRPLSELRQPILALLDSPLNTALCVASASSSIGLMIADIVLCVDM